MDCLKQWHQTFDLYFILAARLTSIADIDDICNSKEKVLFLDSERHHEILCLVGLKTKTSRKGALSRKGSAVFNALFTKKPREYTALVEQPGDWDGDDLFGKEVLLHVPAPGQELCPRNIFHAHHRLARPTSSNGGKGKSPLKSYGTSGSDGMDRPIVIDNIVVGAENEQVSSRVENLNLLAKKLRDLNPAMGGILPCSSITETTIPETEAAKSILSGQGSKQSRRSVVQMSFTIPDFVTPNTSTTTLRGLLLKKTVVPSIRARTQLAFNMAKSLVTLHALGIHHKNITPESFLVFPSVRTLTTSPDDLGTPFLNGFQLVSMQFSVQRHPFGEQIPWSYFLYLHPSRHRSWDSGYNSSSSLNSRIKAFAQDVYSLGVCLLEAGLWSSMAILSEDDGKWVPGKYLQRILLALDPKLKDLSQKQLKDLILCGDISSKDILKRIAELRLENEMNKEYFEVVKSCLCVLETFGFNKRRNHRGETIFEGGSVTTSVNGKSNSDYGKETKGDIGVWYVESVYEKLRRLSQ